MTREIGILTAEPSPLLLDHARLASLDFVVLDAEQSGLTAATCSTAVRMLRGATTRVCIRVPDLAPATLVAFANTGADELVLPQVSGLEQVERAWSAVNYPPQGTRPRQPSPASSFGADFGSAPSLSVIVETAEAVDIAAALAACPLLDGAWIGYTDLRADLELHGRGLEFDTAVDAVLSQFAVAGAPIGLPAPSPEAARDAFARGAARCLVYWESYLHTVFGALRAATAEGAVPA